MNNNDSKYAHYSFMLSGRMMAKDAVEVASRLSMMGKVEIEMTQIMRVEEASEEEIEQLEREQDEQLKAFQKWEEDRRGERDASEQDD